MMNKLVIANRGAGYIGKSSSVRSVYQLLKDNGHKLLVEEWQGKDIKAIFEINGVKVGIESQGDPDSQMEPTMEAFVDAGCEIIVTACRTNLTLTKRFGSILEKSTAIMSSGLSIMCSRLLEPMTPEPSSTPATLTKCINSFRTELTR